MIPCVENSSPSFDTGWKSQALLGREQLEELVMATAGSQLVWTLPLALLETGGGGSLLSHTGGKIWHGCALPRLSPRPYSPAIWSVALLCCSGESWPGREVWPQPAREPRDSGADVVLVLL